jgi:hypothetical protein
MNIVDLLVTIIVVTILVTIVLAVMTYVAYKLRLARRPAVSDEAPRSRYFDLHEAPEALEVPDWDMEAGQEQEEVASPSSRDATSEAPVEEPEVDTLDRVS